MRRYAADLTERIRWSWGRDVGETWREAWKAHFRPTRISNRLAVCPGWEEWAPDDSRVRVIRLDPGRAFGTGTHETTRLCLRLIDEALEGEPPGSFLDVGCGSGILAIGALLLGAARAVALDVDRVAATVARENARVNRVTPRLLTLCGDPRAVRGSYPLVAANILYQILLGLAPTLARKVTPGGRLVLSGTLAPELDPAAELYGKHGLREIRRAVEGEWGALMLTKDRPA
jgi:ribosomal protein L11 methyltransferase